MQYSLQTDVWFKYSTRLSLRNCLRYAMLSLCFVRFSEPLKTSDTGKNRSIGVGGVNRSRKRWGTHSLLPKKIKKNRKLLIFTVRCETQCVVGPWLNS